jgi:ribosome-binding factor A
MMMSRRTERLGSSIQQEIAAIVQRELNDPRIPALTSITRAKISSDLSMADVYISVMGEPGKQTAALNALRHSAGMIRGKLTRSLSLRVAPMLRFHLDENLKKELEVLNLLRQVEREREAEENKVDAENEAETTDE